MKKLLAVLLALCLTAALVPGTALAAGNPFQDVKPGAWYYDQVQYVYNKDLMSGTGSTTFGPSTPTDRGMVAFILYKIEGSPAVSGGSGFVDVTNQYFANAVKWASQNKIVAGTGNGRFTPKSPVTREQLALMLYNYAKYKEFDVSRTKELTGYQDYGKIHTWGREALSWANGMGFINGVGGNRIDPTGNATRAQLAVILCSFCQKYIDSGTSTPTPSPTPAPSGKVSVRFDYNYEGAPAGPVLTVKTGEKVESINPPTREGYTFLGWYTQPAGGSLFSFDTAVSGDMTLYAQWNGAQTFQVAFDLNYEGCLPLDPVNVVSGQLCPFPEFIPQQENHQFEGWYTSPDDKGVKFDFATTPVTASFTLYARWTYIGPNWAMPYQTSRYITQYDGKDPINKNFRMMGLTYTQGLVFASGGRDDSEALFNLGGKYEVMTFDVGHIDNGRRGEEALYFYFDGGSTPSMEIKLTGAMSTEHIVLNVKNRTQLRVVRRGGYDYDYGMANIMQLTAAQAQSEDIVTPANYEASIVPQTNLASGLAVPYQVSRYVYVYDGSDPLKSFQMMGLPYTQGATLQSGGRDESDLLFNLGGGFDMMSFKVGHLDNSRRGAETIYVWADDTMIDTISLTGTMSTTTYSLNVQGVNKLRLVRQGDYDYDYGLADFTVYTASDVQSLGIVVPALSSYEEVNQTHLAPGLVLPYQTSRYVTLYDGTDPVNNNFAMMDKICDFGVTFRSGGRETTDINFNLGKGFTTMSFTVGHINNGRTTAQTLYVYKDGDVNPAETIQLTGNMMNTQITLDVIGVNNLRIERQGGYDYDYGMADITVS